jgi:hypothetical protein
MLRKIVTRLLEFGTDHQWVCEGCAPGNNVKASFPSNDSRSKKILDLVHSNVCGVIQVPSASGFQYYVTLIDDYSRRTWILFMITKDEIFSRFRDFKALVENHKDQGIEVRKWG